MIYATHTGSGSLRGQEGFMPLEHNAELSTRWCSLCVKLICFIVIFSFSTLKSCHLGKAAGKLKKKSQAASLKRKRNSRDRRRMARKRGFNSPLTASAHFYLSETPHSLSLTCTWRPARGFFLPPLLYLLPVQHKKKIRTIKSHSLILSKSN